MKKYLLILKCTFAFTSCHESLEDKAAREAKEFTRKNCPVQASEFIVNDSMTYEKDKRTIHYFYTINGAALVVGWLVGAFVCMRLFSWMKERTMWLSEWQDKYSDDN